MEPYLSSYKSVAVILSIEIADTVVHACVIDCRYLLTILEPLVTEYSSFGGKLQSNSIR
jgi:hypothetical protein